MLIDTHSHIEKSDNIQQILSNANANGIKQIILGGTNKNENENSIELINLYKELYMTIGYHPEYCFDIQEEDYLLLKEQILKNKKIIGIGEIGIDFHYGKENQKEQITLFKRQLKLAEQLKLPVVIHTRDAIELTYEILKQYDVRGIIHCFSGSYEMAKKFIDIGFYLGIGGVVTFKNSKLSEVIKNIGLKNIVLETDSPYLSPIRGEKNEPKNIKFIAEYISNLKQISFEKVEKITTDNATQIFDFNRKI